MSVALCVSASTAQLASDTTEDLTPSAIHRRRLLMEARSYPLTQAQWVSGIVA